MNSNYVADIQATCCRIQAKQHVARQRVACIRQQVARPSNMLLVALV